jgi:hypothetical protein
MSFGVRCVVGQTRIQVGSVTEEVCRFAPEGRDVYSLEVFSLLRSSVGAQSLLPALGEGSATGFRS